MRAALSSSRTQKTQTACLPAPHWSRKRVYELKAVRVLSALAVALAMTCMPSVRAQSQDTIVFGAAVALTGSVANEGRMLKDGYDFWASYANAHGGLTVGNRR